MTPLLTTPRRTVLLHAVASTPWPGEPTTEPTAPHPDYDPGDVPTTDPMEPPLSPSADPDELEPDEEEEP